MKPGGPSDPGRHEAWIPIKIGSKKLYINSLAVILAMAGRSQYIYMYGNPARSTIFSNARVPILFALKHAFKMDFTNNNLF